MHSTQIQAMSRGPATLEMLKPCAKTEPERGSAIVEFIGLSVLLVFASVAAVTGTMMLIAPGMGFLAAMALGAAVAPPDPVSVEAVAEPAGIPRRIITTLQTEGLFNDAASIVAFNLALTAVTQGDELSFGGGVLNFFYSAFVAGGLGWIVGRLVALFITHVHDVTARNALTWVTPFAVYLISEELGASGVIAVVIAAVELNSRADIQAEDRLSGQSFWETVELLFTGVAFGLIGLTVSTAIGEVGSDLWHSVVVGVILSLVAFVVRLVWMYIYYRINVSRGRPRVAPLRLQEVLLMTWSGMRGLVTLALVLSIPAGVFSFHHELAVIALTVLLVTMVVPGLLLPWLMERLDLTEASQIASDKMRAAVVSRARAASIEALSHFRPDGHITADAEKVDPEISANVIQWFEDRLGDGEDVSDDSRKQRAWQARHVALEARRTALAAAQEELLRMRGDRAYNPAIVDEVLEEIDRMVLGAKRH